MTTTKKQDGALPADLPLNEAERLLELESYRILDTLPEQAYDDLVFLAAHICDTPIALVSFVDASRQWFKARVGLRMDETPRDHGFSSHAILWKDGVFEVKDALEDARFNTNPLVTSAPNVRFYAGAPLVTPSGHVLGTLCAIDRAPRALTPDQHRAMSALARAVITQLELRRSIVTLQRELAVTRVPSEPPSSNASAMENRVRALVSRMQRLQRKPVRDDS